MSTTYQTITLQVHHSFRPPMTLFNTHATCSQAIRSELVTSKVNRSNVMSTESMTETTKSSPRALHIVVTEATTAPACAVQVLATEPETERAVFVPETKLSQVEVPLHNTSEAEPPNVKAFTVPSLAPDYETFTPILIYNGNNLIFVEEREGEAVAVKQFIPSDRDDGLRDATFLTLLNHKHIQPILECQNVTGSVRILQPLMDYNTVSMIANRVVTSEQNIRLMFNMLTAIDYLHDNDVVHGDIKPENVLIDDAHVPEDTCGTDPLGSSVEESVTEESVTEKVDPKKLNVSPDGLDHTDSKKSSITESKDDKVPQIDPDSLRLIDFELASLKPTGGQDEWRTRMFYTAHYRPPEVWLRKPWGKPADIWALACTFFAWRFKMTLFPIYDEGSYAQNMKDYIQTLKYYATHGPNKDIQDFRDPKYTDSATGVCFHEDMEIDKESIHLLSLYKFQDCKNTTDKVVLQMIASMTQVDTSKRPTAKQLLKHDLFKGLSMVTHSNSVRTVRQTLDAFGPDVKEIIDWIKQNLESGEFTTSRIPTGTEQFIQHIISLKSEAVDG